MTSGQKKLLKICRDHLKSGETAIALEIVEALLGGEDVREREPLVMGLTEDPYHYRVSSAWEPKIYNMGGINLATFREPTITKV